MIEHIPLVSLVFPIHKVQGIKGHTNLATTCPITHTHSLLSYRTKPQVHCTGFADLQHWSEIEQSSISSSLGS